MTQGIICNPTRVGSQSLSLTLSLWAFIVLSIVWPSIVLYCRRLHTAQTEYRLLHQKNKGSIVVPCAPGWTPIDTRGDTECTCVCVVMVPNSTLFCFAFHARDGLYRSVASSRFIMFSNAFTLSKTSIVTLWIFHVWDQEMFFLWKQEQVKQPQCVTGVKGK